LANEILNTEVKWAVQVEEPDETHAMPEFTVTDCGVPFITFGGVYSACLLKDRLNSYEHNVHAMRVTNRQLKSWIAEHLAKIEELEAEITELKKGKSDGK